MPTTAYHDPSAFDALAAEWNPLVERSSGNSPFLRLEYQRAWWRHMGEGELLTLAVCSEAGELIGIANLYGVQRGAEGMVYSVVGCEEISDYLDLIAAAGREREVFAAVLDFFTGPDAPAWDKIDLCNLPPWSSTPDELGALARGRGLTAEVSTVQYPCPVVDLPETWEAYLNLLGSKSRHEIRRKLRRAESGEDQVRWYIVGAEHDIAVEGEAFLDLMARSTPEKAGFLTPPMRALFREVMQGAQAGGWLRLAFLEVNGQKAAAYLNFDYRDRIWVYNSGLAPDVFAGLSAGWVLTARLIQWAIENRRKRFDFMRGAEPYKYQFGGQDTWLRRLTIRR